MTIRHTLYAAACCAFLSAGFASAAPPTAGYDLGGDAAPAAPGYNSANAVALGSDADAPGYGFISLPVPAGLTFAGLTNLGADYQMTAGACGLGSPRFQLDMVDPADGVTRYTHVYLGTPPNYGCPEGVWLSSGNLLVPGALIDTSQLVGGWFYHPYDQALTAFGHYQVTGVHLVVDAGYAFPDTGQTVIADNIAVGGSTTTFEPVALTADACKKDGWRTITAYPGPFKNQGQCVAYFSRTK